MAKILKHKLGGTVPHGICVSHWIQRMCSWTPSGSSLLMVPNRVGEMYWLVLAVKFGIGNKKTITSGSGISCFYGGWDAGFARGIERDTGFKFFYDLVN